MPSVPNKALAAVAQNRVKPLPFKKGGKLPKFGTKPVKPGGKPPKYRPLDYGLPSSPKPKSKPFKLNSAPGDASGINGGTAHRGGPRANPYAPRNGITPAPSPKKGNTPV